MVGDVIVANSYMLNSGVNLVGNSYMLNSSLEICI